MQTFVVINWQGIINQNGFLITAVKKKKTCDFLILHYICKYRDKF